MLINIFGLAGTGKSTLRNALVAKLSNQTVGKIQGDHYLLSRGSDQSLEDFFNQEDGYDWQLLQRHLRTPLGTVVSTPLYDYVEFRRISDGGNKTFINSSINILDTVVPCPFADVRVLLTVCSQVRKERVTNRQRDDLVWKQRALADWSAERDAGTNQNWSKLAHVVLDSSQDVDVLTKAVVSLL